MAGRARLRRVAARLTPTGLFSRSGRARILVYHSVSDDPLNPFAVSPASFHDQMEHLRSHRVVIPLRDLAAAVSQGGPLPPGAVAVTFDDGYLDNYENAFPILRKFAIPATIFLVAGSIREAAEPPGTDGREITFMTWDQAREMAAGGVTIGSHTVNHPSLSGCAKDRVEKELRDSKTILERKIGREIDSLAYPYGTHRDVDDSVRQGARSAGYTHACMAVNGSVGPGDDVFALPRTKIEFDDDLEMFRGALEGRLDGFTLLDIARKFQGKRGNAV